MSSQQEVPTREHEGHGPVDPGALALAPQEHAVQLLEGFLGLMPDAALVVDGAGTIVSVNEQAEALFGYDPGDLVGRSIEVLVPERFRHQHRRHRSEYLRSPRARPMGAGLELSGRRRDGSEIPVDISLAPLSGLERPLAVAAVRDATERRAAGAAQAQLAAIVQSTTDGIVSTSVDGRITSWNPGAEHLFGYAPGEVVGRHLSTLVPDDASHHLEELLDAVVSGHPGAPLDTQWLRRDGTRLDVALSVSSLADPTGGPLGFSAVVRDNTERMRAERELHRVLAQERLRKRQQEASAEVRLAMLAGASLPEVLSLICERSCELLGAVTAGVVLDHGHELRVVATSTSAAQVLGASLPREGSLVGRAITTGTCQVVACLAEEPGIDHPVRHQVPAGPALAAVIGADGPAGALVLTRPLDADLFTDDDVEFASVMAVQAALALELDAARGDREELMLSRDRDRIARDLHDLVIQRLFAAGMSLQAIARLSPDPLVGGRINRAVDDLDDTIRQIRNTIFGLESGGGSAGLRAELLRLGAAAGEGLGFDPSFRFDGPVDARVPDDVAAHVLAVVREALSNAARHARASRVDVEVRVTDDLVVVVADDGVGLGEGTRRSGLANLRQRAEGLGGSLSATSAPGAGTRLEWTVPLDG